MSQLADVRDAGPDRTRPARPRPGAQAEVSPGLADRRASSAAALQMQALADTSARHRGATVLQQMAAAGPASSRGLPKRLKAGVESLSGLNMDHVTVHYNSSRPAQLDAHAYAQGSDIHLAPGQEKHLPHEAWHLVQQAQGRVRPTMQIKGGVTVNDDRALEAEADTMGARAATAAASGMGLPPPAAPAATAVQAMSVIQRFANTAQARAWLATERANYSAAMTARMQPYIEEFDEQVDLWSTYKTDANRQGVMAAQEKLQDMYRRAQVLDSLKAQIDALKNQQTPLNATAGITLALAFAAPDSWLRKYASAQQRARMTELHASYGNEVSGRNAYIAQLEKIALNVSNISREKLEEFSEKQLEKRGAFSIANAARDFPIVLHDGGLDAEVPLLKASIEAAALVRINAEFAALGATLDEIAAAHTQGSDVPDRLTTLRAFHGLHDDATLDARDSDPMREQADQLKAAARDFVNAQFREISSSIKPVRSVIDVSMEGIAALKVHQESLKQIRAFMQSHDPAVLDRRDYRPFMAQADQLNTDATAWADQEFQGNGTARVELAAFEAAAAPLAGRKTQFKSLIRQGDIRPGAVYAQFYSHQDVIGGYTYAFRIDGAPNTVIHAHYLPDDTLGGAHFKPGGAREGELGHGINQLNAGQIATFVTPARQAYETANGVVPAHRRRPA